MAAGAIVGTVFGVFLLIMIMIIVVIFLYRRRLLPTGYLTEQTPMHFSNPVYSNGTETVDVEFMDPMHLQVGQKGLDNPVYSEEPDTVDVLDATHRGDDSVA